MLFTEKDLVYKNLSDKDFEELCFDLLIKFGFRSLAWRQGGPDSGRDIEGQLVVNNALVESYEEKWFFQCKRYTKGVPPEKLNSTITWADAENPNHVLIFVSSYLTTPARNWIDKIKVAKNYRIHVIEGKNLKKILLSFPDILSNYFIDEYSKLLIEAKRNWLFHDIFPDSDTFQIFSKNLNVNRLSIDDLAFLWCSFHARISEIEEWHENTEWDEPICFDFLVQYLAQVSQTKRSIISKIKNPQLIETHEGTNEWTIVYQKYLFAKLILNPDKKPVKALYSFVYSSEGQGIEVLIEATSNFPTRIRYINKNAGKEFIKTSKDLSSIK